MLGTGSGGLRGWSLARLMIYLWSQDLYFIPSILFFISCSPFLSITTSSTSLLHFYVFIYQLRAPDYSQSFPLSRLRVSLDMFFCYLLILITLVDIYS